MDMDKINNLLQLPKIEIGKKIYIYNYKKIIDINLSFIELEEYIIFGKELRIYKMNQKEIYIKGVWNKIVYKGEFYED
jgi:hypothetical protein